MYSEDQWHLVYGGHVPNVCVVVFGDYSQLELVGVFPNYKTAYDAWRVKQSAVVGYEFRYFISALGRIIDPGKAIVDVNE